MGWAFCGKRKDGIEMGYGIEGVCEHPECIIQIDHGLDHVCGGMHEGGDRGCGKYCCEKHLFIIDFKATNGEIECGKFCEECKNILTAELKDKCQKCNGAGWVWSHELNEPTENGYCDDTKYTCDLCKGSGKIDD